MEVVMKTKIMETLGEQGLTLPSQVEAGLAADSTTLSCAAFKAMRPGNLVSMSIPQASIRPLPKAMPGGN
jgi:hypothetical protein